MSEWLGWLDSWSGVKYADWNTAAFALLAS